MTYQDHNGNAVRLGQKIGGGGEAEIFSIQGKSHVAAKIYTKAAPGRHAKLRAMLGRPPVDRTADRGHLSICWPTCLLFGTVSGAAGFLMPMMDRHRYREVFKVYHPQDRAREAPDFTWQNLLKAAENIASVVQLIHTFGYVVGDINESNFFVSEQTYVTLVDCDSMQVPDSGTIYRCTVGKAEFTPPELQGKDFSAVDRTPEHDHFGLAVLTFLLLMEGVHPYSGVWKGNGDLAIEERIKRGLSPYAGSSQISPMPTALPFQKLPQSTRALFVRAFGDGHKNPAARPTPSEWGMELRTLGQNLKTCQKNTKHLYPAHLGSCMWCERAALFGGMDTYPLVQQGLPAKPFPTPAPARPQRQGGGAGTMASYRPASPAPRPPPARSRTSSGSTGFGAAVSEFVWKTVKVCFALGTLAVLIAVVVGYFDRQTAAPERRPTSHPTSNPSPSPEPNPAPVETWPTDSAALPVLGAIPGGDIRVESLQFFSAGTTPPPLDERKFTNIFDHSDSGNIYWQLNLAHAEHAATQPVELVIYLYGPDESLRVRDKSQLNIEKTWTNSRSWSLWADAISTWPIGEYAVSIFANGAKICVGKFAIQTAAELTQAPSPPPPPSQPDAKRVVPEERAPITDGTAQHLDSDQYARPGPIPEVPETPLARRYRAAHQVAGPDKQGFLTFWQGGFRFDCMNDRRPEQTFVVRREEVQSVHKNGVQLFGGKKYHFTVPGMAKDQVSDLFDQWYRGK